MRGLSAEHTSEVRSIIMTYNLFTSANASHMFFWSLKFTTTAVNKC